MAKKSRTSKSKSNDSQKKLLALVLVILFVGLGVFLVVSSFAAKGGKSKPGSGVTLVDSNYAIKAEPNPLKWGGTIVISAVDKTTGALLNPQPENMTLTGSCSDINGTYTGTFAKLFINGQTSLSPQDLRLANGGSCIGYLNIARNGALVPTAQSIWTITP
jgi:hypothetical protein